MASRVLLFFQLLPAILGLVIPRAAALSAMGPNYLLSGEFLFTNRRLRNGNFILVMQDDCNAVLHNGNWQSNTANRGRGCHLSLSDRGEIIIKTGERHEVFRGGSRSAVRGNYALVVHPEGRLVIYGPSVFTINPWLPRLINSTTTTLRQQLGNIPSTVDNMLFSGQVLYGDGKLTTSLVHMLVMQGDCNLLLYGGRFGSWQSNTQCKGENCFLRLNYNGELAIMDDDFRTIWSSRSSSVQGGYVFILQENGFAVIYGPATWASPIAAQDQKMVGALHAWGLADRYRVA